jgi:RHS repeat-associated protein
MMSFTHFSQNSRREAGAEAGFGAHSQALVFRHRPRRSGSNAYDITYTYDAVGNRLSKEEEGAVTTYAYDAANELLTTEDGSGVTTYAYDEAGNLAASVNPSEEATTYSWDYENRLAAVELPSSAISTFTYKSDGLRVQKEDSAGTTKFIWDGQNVLLETDGDGDTVAAYTLAPAGFGMLLAQRRGDTTKFFHFDAMGSTDRLTNAAQAVSDSYIYEAFGKVLASSGSTANPFRYVGRLGYYFDPELERYYLRARWYDYTTGQFLSRDPVGRSCLYSLSRQNPLGLVDPSGALSCQFIGLYVLPVAPIIEDLGRWYWERVGNCTIRLAVPGLFERLKDVLAGVVVSTGALGGGKPCTCVIEAWYRWIDRYIVGIWKVALFVCSVCGKEVPVPIPFLDLIRRDVPGPPLAHYHLTKGTQTETLGCQCALPPACGGGTDYIAYMTYGLPPQ